MRGGIKKKLFDYLKRCHEAQPERWVNSGFIERQIATYYKNYSKMYKPSNGSRRLRELITDRDDWGNRGFPEIQNRINDNGIVEYRYMPNEEDALLRLCEGRGWKIREEFTIDLG